MPDISPAKYNPRDRIKRHLKRKSSSRCLAPALNSCTPQIKTFDGLDTESCPIPTSSAASNPFKIGSPLKKRKPTAHVNFADSVFDLEENAQDSFTKYSPLKQNRTPTKSPRKSPRKKVATARRIERFRSFDPSNLLKECYATDFSQLLEVSGKAAEKKEDELEVGETIPLDLRIGTKVRMTSEIPFPWMNGRKTTGIVTVRLPGSDRYDGLRYFNQLFMSGREQTIPTPCSNLSLLEAATLYWQFPVIPGMSMYPRISSQLGTVQRVPMPPLVTTTMLNQWVEAYEQLFHSYKKGERESFYVACSVFNVLFTKTSESDEIECNEDSQSCFRTSSGQKMIAIVTHTTSASRENLRSQGVEYEVLNERTMRRLSSLLNLTETSCTSFCDSTENSMLSISTIANPEDGENQPDNGDSDENESPTKKNAQWLKDVGVSPRNVIKHHSRKLSARLSGKDDGISALLGASVQSLYNMLMSSDSVHEKTGPYTKIPPTLLASSAFLYGQLLSLNKTSHIVQKGGGKTSEYVLELDRGPILPHTPKMLFEMVRSSNLCADGKCVHLRVADRHANNGMNIWTDRAKDWNMIEIYSSSVKWSKNM
ncbi:unnamed protein product [Caenorhabditis bovis]|uniref:Uncharacterized protein n=1 Tax=Caenorhabditis bovis TaxID=2654633 RepID=A0A8S1ESR6_9PELO|nr:unnamed protein product [Caenorhabditis bovis]